MLKYFPLILCLFFFASCGIDDDDSSSVLQEEVFGVSDFSTRISNQLLVSGTRCEGGETTEFDGETYVCGEGEWLVVLDNQNICTDDGICTEIYVFPTVAILETTEGPDEAHHYAVIEAISPVSEKQQEVIDSVYVRTELDGTTEAVRR